MLNIECLKAALNSSSNKVAELLIRNHHWKSIFKEADQQQVELVLTNLINNMPDVMELMLDKMYDKQSQIYDFTLIDQPIVKTIKSHPLYQIADSLEDRLLTHHTTQMLIRLKFRNLPRIAFLIDFILYLLYTLTVSFYHLVNEIDLKEINSTNNVSTIRTVYFLFHIDLKVDIHFYNFIFSLLIILTTIHLSKEMFQIANYKPIVYFSSVDNWFQMTTLLLAILSLMPFAHAYQISFGSFSSIFAWISMSLFFQDIQMFGLGRYIVAFRKTIQNSFKFMPFFTMICVGFFFAFKIGEKYKTQQNLHSDEKSIQEYSKLNFLNIIVMMVGDLELPHFDSSSEDKDKFVDIFRLINIYNTLIFLFFVFLMCIIILSLFEGIAVGEIKLILDKAHLEIIASSILYVLNIQNLSYTAYRFMSRKFKRKKEPSFMSFKQMKHKMKISPQKKNLESIKNIDRNCSQMLIILNNLSRKLDHQINQMKIKAK